MINMMQGDCMELMAQTPDKFYELAIVDPPYGIGENGGKNRRNQSRHKKKSWDSKPPDKRYFTELLRVSKNQIIWGANYYTIFLPSSMGWVFWDKKKEKSDFSDGELAYTSFQRALKKFTYSKTGGNVKEFSNRYLHPCEKPVALYKWLISSYAKPGDKILDTHGGSGSICIACHDLGFDLDWIELDEDYYKAAVERYKLHASQAQLFDQAEINMPTQGTLL